MAEKHIGVVFQAKSNDIRPGICRDGDGGTVARSWRKRGSFCWVSATREVKGGPGDDLFTNAVNATQDLI